MLERVKRQEFRLRDEVLDVALLDDLGRDFGRLFLFRSSRPICGRRRRLRRHRDERDERVEESRLDFDRRSRGQVVAEKSNPD